MINTDGTLDNNQIQKLISQEYMLEIATYLAENNLTFPLRFWIVDSIELMAMMDRCQMIMSNSHDEVRMIVYTRCGVFTESTNKMSVT